MRKTPKFKSGDKVYIKKQSGIVFGTIVQINQRDVVSYRQSKVDPRRKRLSRRVKISYLVSFDEPVQDLRRTRHLWQNRGQRRSQFVAQSSIRLIPEDEGELVRKLLGDDYL